MSTKKNSSRGHYGSSSTEELAGGWLDDLDALRPDFLYGPRFRPVMKNQIRHSSSQFVVARTISKFASIKKVRALQIVERGRYRKFEDITRDAAGILLGG